MSLRSRVRRLTGRTERVERAERQLIQLEIDRDELFRRTDAQLDLIGRAAVNDAVSEQFDATREETLLGFRILDEAIGALHARLETLEAKQPRPPSHPIPSYQPARALEVAIARERVVTFKYRDREGKSSYRVVSPYELEECTPKRFVSPTDGFLSLLAYDHGREGIRHFRVERIEGPVAVTRIEEYRAPQE